MKKKNGFTLIELLAIIVILAIIAVITVPIILNIIENSRKGAATDSAYGYKDAVNKYYISELQNHNKLKLDGKYTVKSDGSLEPTEDNEFGFGDSEYGNSLDVSISGTIPSSGKLRYSNNVLNAGCVVIEDYKVTFGTDGKTNGTEKGNCENYEFPSENAQDNSGQSSDPALVNYTIDEICPGCVFTSDGGNFKIGEEFDSDIVLYTYEDFDENTESYTFIGMVLNGNVIERAFVCGVDQFRNDPLPVCIEGNNTSNISRNVQILNHFELDESCTNGTCFSYDDEGYVRSEYGDSRAEVFSDGTVIMQ